jgi:hypothetical protein
VETVGNERSVAEECVMHHRREEQAEIVEEEEEIVEEEEEEEEEEGPGPGGVSYMRTSASSAKRM